MEVQNARVIRPDKTASVDSLFLAVYSDLHRLS